MRRTFALRPGTPAVRLAAPSPAPDAVDRLVALGVDRDAACAVVRSSPCAACGAPRPTPAGAALLLPPTDANGSPAEDE